MAIAFQAEQAYPGLDSTGVTVSHSSNISGKHLLIVCPPPLPDACYLWYALVDLRLRSSHYLGGM